MKQFIVCLCFLLCGMVAFAQKGISEIESGAMEDATLYDPEGNPVSICALVTVIATEDSGRRLIITQVVGPGRQVMIEAIYEREGYFHPIYDSEGTLIKIEVYDAGKDYPSLLFEPTSADEAHPSYQCFFSVDPDTRYCAKKAETDDKYFSSILEILTVLRDGAAEGLIQEK